MAVLVQMRVAGGGLSVFPKFTVHWVDFSDLWERLVNEDLQLQDMIPAEHRVATKIFHRLVGRPTWRTSGFPNRWRCGLYSVGGRRRRSARSLLQVLQQPIESNADEPS